MKRIFNAAMSVLLLFVCFAAQTARAGIFMDTPTPLKYERCESYFEKNNSSLSGEATFHVFSDQSNFDKIFGSAAVMGKNSFLPDDVFENRLVFAVIKRGNFMVNYKVTRVAMDSGNLRVNYRTTVKPVKSATFATPLILAIDKKDFNFSGMIVTENGKEVYKVSFKK